MAAASSATRVPARVEPVNDTRSTPGCRARASPTTGPVPQSRLKTPAGSPASCTMLASSYAASGATSVVFSTIGQPAASAAAILLMIWYRG